MDVFCTSVAACHIRMIECVSSVRRHSYLKGLDPPLCQGVVTSTQRGMFNAFRHVDDHQCRVVFEPLHVMSACRGEEGAMLERRAGQDLLALLLKAHITLPQSLHR